MTDDWANGYFLGLLIGSSVTFVSCIILANMGVL